jgi:hypothetical protein
MNERIREVWIKAAREDSDTDNWDTQEQFIERFAELIVKECLSYMKDGDIDFVKFMIKRNFGVEE